MHDQSTDAWRHDHSFGQDRPRAGERRTLVVTLLTLATMAVEIVAGLAFGSMALLADGLHMASHSFALGLAYLAYWYARHHAHDRRFTFGTGKLNALAGYTSATLLAGMAALMGWESVARFFHPVAISYGPAIAIAVVGLIVNVLSAVLLDVGEHEHDHPHATGGDDPGHAHDPRHDHNLRAAYLHVLADAATSVLAILALTAGRFLGWAWLDPLIGIAGAVLILAWSHGLLRDAGAVLLDRQAPDPLSEAVRQAVEADGDARLADLHLWSIGSGGYAAAMTVVAHQPLPPDDYKRRLPVTARIAHVTIEVQRCPTDH